MVELSKKLRPGTILTYLAGVGFIFFGIWYSPDFFARLLTSTGQLPAKISLIIWENIR